MNRFIAALTGALLIVYSSFSQETATLDEVLVTGEQPGPGLWRVSKDGHVLWVLGTYGPLPKKMQWRSKEVEAVIAESQALLLNGSVNADIGFFRGLTLLPSLIGIRNNPEDQKLKDVLPPEIYARWKPLKDKYIGRDNDPEKWRPIFAAQHLFREAVEKSGLVGGGIIWPVVEKSAKKHKLEFIRPRIEVEIEKPRAMIKEFKRGELSDLDCFAKTIERLETDLDAMRVRANAWAKGDIATLKRMVYVNQATACIEAVMNAQLVQQRGYNNLPAQVAKEWNAAARAAIEKNPSTVALLPIDEILKPDGYIATLKSQGYEVEEP